MKKKQSTRRECLAFGTARNVSQHNYSKKLPRNWRLQLPKFSLYFPAHVEGLRVSSEPGVMQGKCPFHHDKSESLRVDLTTKKGQWQCKASCGHGDMLAYHMRLRRLDFHSAVLDLIRFRGLKGIEEAGALLVKPEPITSEEVASFGVSVAHELKKNKKRGGS